MRARMKKTKKTPNCIQKKKSKTKQEYSATAHTENRLLGSMHNIIFGFEIHNSLKFFFVQRLNEKNDLYCAQYVHLSRISKCQCVGLVGKLGFSIFVYEFFVLRLLLSTAVYSLALFFPSFWLTV